MNPSSLKDLILYEDEHYLLINKPPGIAILHDDSEGEPEFLHKKLIASYPGLKVCHRLDKETSGVIVFAKNDTSFKHISTQFELREVEKIYHAIALSTRDYDHFSAEFPLAVTSRNRSKVDILNGKESDTVFNTLKKFSKCQLIECRPKTGRMHQIRVHLSYLNSPVLGDVDYGGSFLTLSDFKRNYKFKKEEEPKPLIKRTALHSFSIRFKSLEGKSLLFSAPYPKDFLTCLKILERWGW